LITLTKQVHAGSVRIFMPVQLLGMGGLGGCILFLLCRLVSSAPNCNENFLFCNAYGNLHYTEILCNESL